MGGTLTAEECGRFYSVSFRAVYDFACRRQSVGDEEGRYKNLTKNARKRGQRRYCRRRRQIPTIIFNVAFDMRERIGNKPRSRLPFDRRDVARRQLSQELAHCMHDVPVRRYDNLIIIMSFPSRGLLMRGNRGGKG